MSSWIKHSRNSEYNQNSFKMLLQDHMQKKLKHNNGFLEEINKLGDSDKGIQI